MTDTQQLLADLDEEASAVENASSDAWFAQVCPTSF